MTMVQFLIAVPVITGAWVLGRYVQYKLEVRRVRKLLEKLLSDPEVVRMLDEFTEDDTEKDIDTN